MMEIMNGIQECKEREISRGENNMQNKYSRKQLEELYNCKIFKTTTCNEDNYVFWRHKGYHLQKMAKTGYLGMPVDGIWMNCMKISGMQFAKLALYLTHNKNLMVHALQPNNNNSCSKTRRR